VIPYWLPATAKYPDEPLELLIVEGQSALQAIDNVRHRRSQAVLSLQGKIPNAAARSRKQVLAHAQTKQLISVLGTGVEADCDPKLLQFHRICILTEADADGQHALWLLLQLFRRYMAPLLSSGVVIVIQAPLARIDTPDETRYLWNDNEKRRYLECRDAEEQSTISVFKGIASLSATDRHHWLVNPATRREQMISIAHNGRDFA